MPYTIRGSAVVKKHDGAVVGHSTTPKKYLRVLQAIEHGWRPSGKYKPTSRKRAQALKARMGN